MKFITCAEGRVLSPKVSTCGMHLALLCCKTLMPVISARYCHGRGPGHGRLGKVEYGSAADWILTGCDQPYVGTGAMIRQVFPVTRAFNRQLRRCWWTDLNLSVTRSRPEVTVHSTRTDRGCQPSDRLLAPSLPARAGKIAQLR